MHMPKNKFRQALLSGQPLYGLWQGIPSTTSAEICAGAGFDWLVIDGEHSPIDLQQMLAHLQAVAPYDVAPIVRPVMGTAAIVKQLLDIGAQTLLIPMIETAAEAEEMVRATRYPPDGVRGVGAALARASRWTHVGEYVKYANDEVFLIVQIESRAALDNLDEILLVDGVDSVFIGPADLSASLGHPGNPGHADVQSAITDALAKIRSAGKFAGILSSTNNDVEKNIARGAHYVGVGIDVVVLASGVRALVKQYKNEENS
ncbi:MAG: 4-hydroxy-2-oxoheptanedioate aldolase [Parasphingorhabdus sp.]|jgi:4-hydroxy-2-oxoheptanedioate aldolase